MYKAIHITNKQTLHLYAYKDKPDFFSYHFCFFLKNCMDEKWKNSPLEGANFPWLFGYKRSSKHFNIQWWSEYFLNTK